MKIWIDLTNSPHVNFFSPFIREWEESGHTVIITCRDLANTIGLVKQKAWKYHEVGGHAGKSIARKTFFFPRRILQLYKFLKKHTPDVAISHSSFYSPITASLLGIPSIYLNDNEFARGNVISFLFASKIFVPEYLPNYKLSSSSRVLSKICNYPGIKEGIYLSEITNLKPRNNKNSKKKIYIRLEPWAAQYYKGGTYFFDDLLIDCVDSYEVVLLPRGEEQINYYSDVRFKKITVLQQPVSLEVIVNNCDLFIGAGGTMTRELAFLGVPTISIYQDELLEVDKYLVKQKRMIHEPSLTLERIEYNIASFSSQPVNEDLYQKGIMAYEMIRDAVYSYGNKKL